MNLLYCLNGVVLAYHDDQDAPVAASAYGTGVQIIPYDQPMATLSRVGTAPTNPAQDTRPYAQPTETTALLLAYAAQVRFDTSTSGITFNAASGAIPVACDRISQMLIGNLASYAATLATSTAIDFTQNKVHYPLLASECATLFNAVNAFIQQCRTIEANCIVDLNSASPTILTYADVDAKFSGLRR